MQTSRHVSKHAKPRGGHKYIDAVAAAISLKLLSMHAKKAVFDTATSRRIISNAYTAIWYLVSSRTRSAIDDGRLQRTNQQHEHRNGVRGSGLQGMNSSLPQF